MSKSEEKEKKTSIEGWLVLIVFNVFIFFVAFLVYPRQYIGWETAFISAVVILMVLMILGVDMFVIALGFLRLTGYKSKGKIEEERIRKKIREDKEKGACCSKCRCLEEMYCTFQMEEIEHPDHNYCIGFEWK